MHDFSSVLNLQRDFFASGETKSPDFRIRQLHTLKKMITGNENLLMESLYNDFRKPAFESFATELGLIISEINFAVKNLNKWVRPESVPSGLVNFPSKNYIVSEPYGNTLIISPWNYPVLLALQPLVSALAAGNTAILKPSEFTPHTSRLLAELAESFFYRQLVAVVNGGPETAQKLLQLKFDYIFFTGSTRVGRLVMKAAAEHLTPLTLELGGKSPCIVDKTANPEIAAKRIAWGKFVNAGQTCVAPDYLLVHEDIKDELLLQLEKAVTGFYGTAPEASPDYPRIVNAAHFERIENYLKDGTVVFGGKTNADERYISPTVIENIPAGAPVMQEEIFGPVLPVLTYRDAAECIETVQQHPDPLALYVFTTDEDFEEYIINGLSFGGGAVNDTVAHLGSHHMGFGGVGSSGFGAYHGKTGFDTFSHKKSIMKKPFWPDVPLRYPPYDGKLSLLKKIFK